MVAAASGRSISHVQPWNLKVCLTELHLRLAQLGRIGQHLRSAWRKVPADNEAGTFVSVGLARHKPMAYR